MFAVLVPALLAVTLAVAACGGEAETTTTQAVTTTTRATTTTTDSGEAMFRGDLQRTGVFESTGPSQEPRLVWEFETSGTVASSPAVSDGVLYFGTTDNYLYALDIQTGQEKWKFQTGGPVRSSPAIFDGVVYESSDDGYLYAVDAETGQEKWKFQTGGPARSSPAISDGVLYFGSNDGYLYAMDAGQGTEKWKFQTGGAVSSSPALSGGVAYFGSRDGYLYAVDTESGTERWKFKTELPAAALWSDVAVSDGVVYITNSGPSPYVGLDDSCLYAVDSQSGQEKWELQKYNLTAPAVSDGVLYFGSAVPLTDPSAGGSSVTLGKDCLYAVDGQSGTEKWTFRAEYSSGAMLSPSVSGGMVYIQATGALRAVDIDTGQELWDFLTPGFAWREAARNSSPAISGGVIYGSSIDITMKDSHYYIYAVK